MEEHVVTYSDTNTICKGLLIRAAATKARSPGVLIVHDIRGVGRNPQLHIDKLVGAGYVVLVADMFGDGMVPRDFEHGRSLIADLQSSRQKWGQRVQAALSALIALPGVDPTRIAAVGYCFGGSTVLELAFSGASICAAISLHGGVDRLSLDAASNVKASLLVCSGADDPIVSADSVYAFETAMRASSVKDWQVLILSGAKHSYTNSEAPETAATGYNERADRRSLAAMMALLADVFK
jgi:dienelactone hydrolase